MTTHIAVIGAAFSANKGAASMLQAVIDNVPDRLGDCAFAVLTTYPKEDVRERPDGPIEIVPYRPWELVFPLLPLALLIGVLRLFGGTGRSLARWPALGSLMRADLVIDVAGISFSDTRSFPILVYNTLMTGIPVLLGCRVVKGSQALGPFEQQPTRIAAHLVLPRLEAVVARGQRTAQHLGELGLSNVREAADIAFTMKVDERSHRIVRELLGETRDAPVAVVPSTVVREYCDGAGIPYVEMLVGFIEAICASGQHVILFPHSARPGRGASRMNDLPLVREIGARVAAPGCRVIDTNLGPAVLRALIARSSHLVTSRFHAMVSALATETPVLVVGWSHKYEEVLAEFELQGWAMDYVELNVAALSDRFRALQDASDEVHRLIERNLPRVLDHAAGTFNVIEAVIRGDRAR